MKMLCREIPFGSGLFLSIFGRWTANFIRRVNRRGKPVVIFLHPWQLAAAPAIKSAVFRLSLLRHNPFCLPYTRNLSAVFTSLLEKNTFISFQEFFNGE